MGIAMWTPAADQQELMQFLANLTTVAGGITIIIGVILALRELNAMANSQRFSGAQEYYRLLEEAREAREYVYHSLPTATEELEKLSRDEVKKAESVVNFLNKIVYLLDRNLLPKDIVFRMTHSMFIRLIYRLEPFIRWREQRLGARWGRRVLELSHRAKRYHELNPIHRKLPVFLEGPDGKTTLLFSVHTQPGIRSLWLNATRQINWMLRRY